MDESQSYESLGEASDDELFAIVRGPRAVDAADSSPETGPSLEMESTPESERSPGAEPSPEADRAFELLFERNHARVYRWCLRILGDPMRAEDAVQAVFLDLWLRSGRYERRHRFGAWLYVLTRNRCLNLRRAEQRRPDEELDPVILETLAGPSDPHAELERDELDARVREVCERRLTEREQEVVVLRYTWGMKVDEITRFLELPNASGARTHLRSAEDKLRRYLKSLRRDADGG